MKHISQLLPIVFKRLRMKRKRIRTAMIAMEHAIEKKDKRMRKMTMATGVVQEVMMRSNTRICM